MSIERVTASGGALVIESVELVSSQSAVSRSGYLYLTTGACSQPLTDDQDAGRAKQDGVVDVGDEHVEVHQPLSMHTSGCSDGTECVH